ncbi:DUF6920 family protein [Halohasta salina]|uniref:DUF6920 family protein n=1 Tax=Halohasta salina TaxID=2961621 RepID=UPI0020A33FCB|nr:DUF6544 family protein [Halohasta salina]
MRRRRLLGWIGGLGIGIASAVTLGSIRLDRKTERRVDDLLAAAEPVSAGRLGNVDRSELPAPVRRYFEAVLDDVTHVRSARLEQQGEFRLGGRSGSWKPMTATQHYTVDPPGFLWDAEIAVAPLLSTRVVDAYEDGKGSLRAVVGSLVPVADAAPSPALDEGELLRYLAEAVWLPTALLPEAGVDWEAVDAHAARATIEDGDTTASLVFQFDDEGLVDRVIGERYRQETDSYASWVGHFDSYEWHDGMRIPTAAAVEWSLPEGDLPYWRARITSTEYRRA